MLIKNEFRLFFELIFLDVILILFSILFDLKLGIL